jgi:hypothetical protein
MGNDWAKAHPERHREIQKDWARRNREQVYAQQKAWRDSNPESVKATDRRTKMKQKGITVEEYDARLEAQDGLCAICRQLNASVRRLAVDHNHETGEIRGLLCSHCNRALGLFKDDPALLKAAIDYLLAGGFEWAL